MSSKGLDALLALPSTSLLPRDGKDGEADVRPTATLGDLRDAKATVYGECCYSETGFVEQVSNEREQQICNYQRPRLTRVCRTAGITRLQQ